MNFFSKNDFRIYTLKEYLNKYFDELEPFVNTLEVKQSVLFTLNHVNITLHNDIYKCLNLVDENENKEKKKELPQPKSLSKKLKIKLDIASLYID